MASPGLCPLVFRSKTCWLDSDRESFLTEPSGDSSQQRSLNLGSSPALFGGEVCLLPQLQSSQEDFDRRWVRRWTGGHLSLPGGKILAPAKGRLYWGEAETPGACEEAAERTSGRTSAPDGGGRITRPRGVGLLLLPGCTSALLPARLARSRDRLETRKAAMRSGKFCFPAPTRDGSPLSPARPAARGGGERQESRGRRPARLALPPRRRQRQGTWRSSIKSPCRPDRSSGRAPSRALPEKGRLSSASSPSRGGRTGTWEGSSRQVGGWFF